MIVLASYVVVGDNGDLQFDIEGIGLYKLYMENKSTMVGST
jgi:hypothetical protein